MYLSPYGLIWNFLQFYINGIIQCVFFILLSISLVTLRFMHVVVCINKWFMHYSVLFFFSIFPLYRYVPQVIYLFTCCTFSLFPIFDYYK